MNITLDTWMSFSTEFSHAIFFDPFSVSSVLLYLFRLNLDLARRIQQITKATNIHSCNSNMIGWKKSGWTFMSTLQLKEEEKVEL